MVGGPLVAATGVAGASLILGAVAVVGVLLVLGLSIGVIVGATARASRAAAAKARESVKLAPIGEGVDVDAAPASTGPAPFDYAQYEDAHEPDASHPSSCPSRSPNRSRPHCRPPPLRPSRSRWPRTRAVSSTSTWATTSPRTRARGSCRRSTS